MTIEFFPNDKHSDRSDIRLVDRAELNWISATDLSKVIRQTLKAIFPRTKFSVRSSYYSMGSSVTVSWVDGPTTAQVDRALDSFRGKHFNGSDDSTSYSPILVNGERVKCGAYVSTSRRLSDSARAVATRVAADRGQEFWPIAARMMFTASGYLMVEVK